MLEWTGDGLLCDQFLEIHNYTDAIFRALPLGIIIGSNNMEENVFKRKTALCGKKLLLEKEN